MKRSEIIKIIQSNLKYQYGHFRHGNSELYEADIILKAIEEAGMLPPETSLNKCKDPDIHFKYNRDDFDSGMDCCIPQYFTCGWDEE